MRRFWIFASCAALAGISGCGDNDSSGSDTCDPVCGDHEVCVDGTCYTEACTLECGGFGVCTWDGSDNEVCQCWPGYSADNGPCTDIDECTLGTHTCASDDLCVNTPGGFTCTCPADIDHCDPDPCQNGGTCVDLADDFLCLCPDGYEGTTCETETNECTPNPCLNGGTCTDQVAGFSCDCPEPYAGTTCEVCVPDCLGRECGDDRCGDSCGDCTGGDVCQNGQCLAVPTKAYVGMSTTDSLVVVDLTTGTPSQTGISLLPEGDYPYDLTLRPGTSEVWIVGASGDGVIVYDAVQAQVVDRVDLTGTGEYAVSVTFDTTGNNAFVASRDNSTLVFIDAAARTVTSTLPMGFQPGQLAYDPCSGDLFGVEWYGGIVFRVDLGTLNVSSSDLGSASLWNVAVAPNGSAVYATDRSADQVHVINPTTLAVSTSVGVGDDPWGLELTSDGALAVVACEDDHTVWFIDTSSFAASSLTLAADADPRDVDISADNTLAYVPSGTVAGNDVLYEINLTSRTISRTLDLGATDTNANVVGVKPPRTTCAP